ncbi:MAG: hypothetical protein EON54_07975 [Alcaligenaceae bacterium]|nr:MAG: hypothetical protein EON54_07975 [Alcaligenaceae bacterium]
MNITHFEHALYAVLIQAVFMLTCRSMSMPNRAAVGAAFAAGFFISREHAQREYKIGDPSKLMPWEAFDIWNWSLDAKLDLIFPVVGVLLVLVAARLYYRRNV